MEGSVLRLMSIDGQNQETIVWPDDVTSLGQPLSRIKGGDTLSGQPVWLDAGFKRASSTVWRSQDGRRDAVLSSDRSDGTGSVEIRQGFENTLLMLRQKNGRKINDHQLLGWLDNDTLAVVGIATSTRNIFALDLNGMVTSLSQLPDDAWLIKVADGAVYYARATPGEGIESAQQPPSSLWRVDKSGQAKDFYDVQDRVIQDFTVSDQAIMFMYDNGNLEWWDKDSARVWDVGQGKPLLALPGLGFLCKQQDRYFLIDVVNSQVKRTDLEIGQAEAVFYLPQSVLDGSRAVR
jgi:hypothetical protein